jgi:SPP1 family predicted phage head-tail adaptor
MKHYRHKIEFQFLTNSQNEFGENEETWATLAEVWALVEQQSGSEKFRGGEMIAVGAFRIETWWREDVTADCRIKFGDRYLEIENVANDGGLDRKMTIIAKEIISNQE